MKNWIKGILISFILGFAFSSISAYAQKKDITVDYEGTLSGFMKEVKSLSGYSFAYSNEDVDLSRTVSVKAVSAPVEDVVRKAVSPIGLKVWREGTVIVIVKGESSLSLSEKPASHGVSGKVLDRSGKPVAGAAVMVRNTGLGVMTGMDGSFTIDAKPGEVILVSCLGYEDASTRVSGTGPVTITLNENIQFLEESVIVGYGTLRKKDVVGAVEQISGETLSSRSNPNAVRSIQGQVPGLTLEFADGKPNHGASLSIRGTTNSIGSGGSSLVLVDGMEASLSDVNPDDIETVSVLKDASSCAIYGARGTFGVILITTKNATNDRFSVKYDASVGVIGRTVVPNLVTNSLDWVEMFYESYNATYGYDPTGVNNMFDIPDGWYQELINRSDPAYEKYGVEVSVNPLTNRYEYYAKGTDWDALMYKKYGTNTTHSISITGGSGKIKFLASGRYFHQNGIYNTKYENYNQINGRFKLTANIKPWWTLENSIDFVRTTYNQPMSFTGHYTVGVQLDLCGAPVLTPTNPDGSWTNPGICTNYAVWQTGKAYQKDYTLRMNENLASTFHIIPGVLDFRADFTYSSTNIQRDRKESKFNYKLGPDTETSRPAKDSYEELFRNTEYWKTNGYFTYTPHLGSSNMLKVTAGVNLEHQKHHGTAAYRQGLILEDKANFALMDGENMKISDYSSYTWAYLGAFARVNYSLLDRYLFEISFREDGSSKFPTSQRWGFFPSASVGWRFSEESFMDGTKSWMDNAKIRLSAGSLGNGNVSPYSYLQTMSIGSSSIVVNGVRVSVTEAPNPIPDGLTWERVTTYDAGLDLDFLGNRLNFVGDYYHKYTTDMYTVGKTLPAVFGKTSPKGNYADMVTKGWELSLSWRDSFKVGSSDFNYGIKGMLWDARSWITRYNNATRSLNDYYAGQELGEVWGYHILGLFESDEEAASWADQTGFRLDRKGNVYRAGDLKYEDKDGSGAIDYGDNTADNPGDMTVIGNTTPRLCYGLNLNASWNGIGLTLFFQGVGKRDWYPSLDCAYFWGKYNRPYGLYPKIHTVNRWTEDNPDPNAFWPRTNSYLTTDTSGLLIKGTADRYLVDASYCRLKSIMIDYTFPHEVVSKAGLEGLRIYLSGENLFTFTPMRKWTDNMDPEVISSGDADFNGANTKLGTSAWRGDQADGNSYPMLRSITFGLNVTF